MDIFRTVRPSETQSGPRTRSAFTYQDKCVCLAVLDRALTESIEGVLVEYATDLVIFPKCGRPELISIKNREPHQRTSLGWTPTALHKQAVLQDLYQFWLKCDRNVTVTVFSPAGLQGEAASLRSHQRDEDSMTRAINILGRCGIPEEDRRDFARDLFWPETPMPHHAHIDDVLLASAVKLLEQYDRPLDSAQEVVDVLMHLVYEKSVDIPKWANEYPTVAEKSHATQRDLFCRRYIDGPKVVEALLTAADIGSSGSNNEPDLSEPPGSIEREGLLEEIDAAFTANGADRRPVVVLAGPSGSGKTSLALRWAANARRNGVAQSAVLLDGSTRVALQESIFEEFGNGGLFEIDPNQISAVIIDGVSDPANIQDLFPRSSCGFVILTSIHSSESIGFREVPVQGFTRDESLRFLRSHHSQMRESEGRVLADALDDNPLALSQAVGALGVLGLSSTEYISALRKSPQTVLDMNSSGVAGGSLVRSITLQLDEVSRSDRDASLLLQFLSVIGPAPVLMEHLGSVVVTVLDGSDILHPEQSRPDALSLELGKMLSDVPRLMRALYSLRVRNLVARQGGAFAVHSLVAGVVVESIDKVRPFLEVAFGLLVSGYSDQSPSPVKEPDFEGERGAAIAQRLIDLGRKEDVLGPALYISCSVYAPWIGFLDPDEGARVAELGHDWHVRATDARALTLEHRLNGEFAYAQALGAAGRHKDAFVISRALLSWLTEVEISADTSKPLIVGLARLCAGSAFEVGDGELEGCRRTLCRVVEVFSSEVELRFSLELVGLLIDWQQGHLNGVGKRLPRILEMAQRLDIEVFKVASFGAAYARLTGSGGDFWADVLAKYADSHGLSIAVRFDALVAASDAMVDSGNRKMAQEYLNRAREVSSYEEMPQYLEGCFMGVNGRLLLEQSALNPKADAEGVMAAAEALSEALEIFETLGPVAHFRCASILINLAAAEVFLGKGGEALTHANRALVIDEERYGPEHPEVKFDRETIEGIRGLFPMLG